MYKNLIKRVIDVVLSFLGLILLSPLFLIIAILIKCESKGPVFFTQKRVGKDKRIFTLYKFRSMRTDAPKDVPTHLLADPKSYITKVGSFLRKTSADELPQLWNILIGDMSVIGPRPALYNQYDLIEERDKYNANSLRPGLTGYAQINGRDEVPIEVKARLDGYYVDNLSFLFDCKCFINTIAVVLGRYGYREGAQEDTTDNRDKKDTNSL